MIEIKTDTEIKEGLDLVKSVISPEIDKFDIKFRELSNSPLTGMEREVLKVYLFLKLNNRL